MGVSDEPRRKKKRARKARRALGPTPGVGVEAFQRAKRWAIFSSLGLLLGILLTATHGEILGPLGGLALALAPWISVASMAAAVAAAHNIGRCGPDPGDEFEPAPHSDRG